MSEQKTSVVDVAKRAGEPDLFGIEKYEHGLINFLRQTDTPLTVAIQGEWGSGKTSLLNTLNLKLCEEDNAPYHGVWLNTWEYALMKEPQETLVSIIGSLLEKILLIGKDLDGDRKMEVRNKFFKFTQAALLGVGKIAANVAASGSGNMIENVVKACADSSESPVTISTLRKELKGVVQSILEKTGRRGILFFVDDLDRIDPPVAVRILELLKNIFDIPKCVFVLAVDYDVIIKGLNPKFGALTPENEREFRSFFDKIIQMPFTMPVASYNAKNFLKDKLAQIGYLQTTQVNSERIYETLNDLTVLSIGTNPRSIKRLMNALSLISCIHKAGAQS